MGLASAAAVHGYSPNSTVITGMRSAAGAILLILALAAGAAAQGAEGDGPVDVDELPVSVERIEEDLSKEPAISLESTRPLFRIEIVAPRQGLLDDIDWTSTRDRIGPTVPIPSLHEQFIARVTPPEARLYGAFEGAELFQVAVTSLLQGLAARKVVDQTKALARKRREEQASKEVDEAIERWRKKLEEERGK
jgi:hypothetical protein